MGMMTLPHVPAAGADELLTSWLERIAIFYGLDLEAVRIALGPGAPRDRGVDEDLDADAALRDRVAQWAGVPEARVPRLIRVACEQVLPVSARVAYCPACWDADVSAGVVPYVRRAWARWDVVHCARHRMWLAARRPRVKGECPWSGWSAVWRSHPQWARAHGLPFDGSLQPIALAFDPGSLHAPEPSWDEFSRTAAALSRSFGADEGGRASKSVLATVAGPRWLPSRGRVLLALRRPGAQLAAINDLDLLGYASDVPGWLPQRIACVVAAVDLVRSRRRRPGGIPATGGGKRALPTWWPGPPAAA